MSAQLLKAALRLAEARAKPEADADVLVDYSSRPPLVPDGKYQAVFIRHETAFVVRGAKVFLWFRIVEPGEYFGVELYRPYRVRHLVGKPAPGVNGDRFPLKSGGRS